MHTPPWLSVVVLKSANFTHLHGCPWSSLYVTALNSRYAPLVIDQIYLNLTRPTIYTTIRFEAERVSSA